MNLKKRNKEEAYESENPLSFILRNPIKMEAIIYTQRTWVMSLFRPYVDVLHLCDFK